MVAHLHTDPLEYSVLYRVIKENRADVLRVLLDTVTDGVFFKPIMDTKLTLRQYATYFKAKACWKVIKEFERKWMKKVAVLEHGYSFDCC